MDVHAGLAVHVGGEHFLGAGRNGRVAADHTAHHAAHRFDAERERSHVEQQHVLDFAAEHAALHCRAHRDHFVRVHAAIRVFAEQVADLFPLFPGFNNRLHMLGSLLRFLQRLRQVEDAADEQQGAIGQL